MTYGGVRGGAEGGWRGGAGGERGPRAHGGAGRMGVGAHGGGVGCKEGAFGCKGWLARVAKVCFQSPTPLASRLPHPQPATVLRHSPALLQLQLWLPPSPAVPHAASAAGADSAGVGDVVDAAVWRRAAWAAWPPWQLPWPTRPQAATSHPPWPVTCPTQALTCPLFQWVSDRTSPYPYPQSPPPPCPKPGPPSTHHPSRPSRVPAPCVQK